MGAGGGAGAFHTLDVQRAAESLRHAKRPRIHTFIATSDIHLKYKLKKSRHQVLNEAAAAVALARTYTDDVEFSAEDATRTDLEFSGGDLKCRGRGGRSHREHSRTRSATRCRDEYGALIGRIVEVTW